MQFSDVLRSMRALSLLIIRWACNAVMLLLKMSADFSLDAPLRLSA